MFFIYLSDIHANIEALKQISTLPEMDDPNTQFRFGGDYSDGYILKPNATIDTWNFIKSLCDSNKAKAILGNHDVFVLDAVYDPYKSNPWLYNGMSNTIDNLNIPFVSPSDFREQMLFHFYDQLNWLKSLPFYIQDNEILLTHAGFDLSKPLQHQNQDTMLWIRDPYIFHKSPKIHPDFENKVIVTGHTPTINITHSDHCPILFKPSPSRYFIDGGSNSGHPTHRINLLKLDEYGNEIWRKYATEDGIFDY